MRLLLALALLRSDPAPMKKASNEYGSACCDGVV